MVLPKSIHFPLRKKGDENRRGWRGWGVETESKMEGKDRMVSVGGVSDLVNILSYYTEVH